MRKHGGKGPQRQFNSPWFARSVKKRRAKSKIAKQSRRKNR